MDSHLESISAPFNIERMETYARLMGLPPKLKTTTTGPVGRQNLVAILKVSLPS